ncbi:dehydration-responsive element-binding protein 1B-like [Diospyros lotus]|uniref:dehydration-responsive element-binding protein 1B-like n=1 Tax=Diospyros lotus TaxID=55363 RepID=UPI0022500D69|nr:dehydration-responsive element-binding protein 1B-like [Diospyros lotus]
MLVSSSSSSSSSCENVTDSMSDKLSNDEFRETRHPVYKGVRPRNGDGWACEMREPNKKSRMPGTFSIQEMDSAGQDKAALSLLGQRAKPNFPDSAVVLPQSKSASATTRSRGPPSIRAAEAFSGETSSRKDSCQENGIANGVGSSLLESSASCSGNAVWVEQQGVAAEFLDEEAVFNMPGLLNNMAEGLLLPPLAMERGFDWGHIDLTLWRD